MQVLKEDSFRKDHSIQSQFAQNTKPEFKPNYYSNQLQASPLTDADSNLDFFKNSTKTNYKVANQVCISGDSKNFTNSISFKNFQGSEKTSSSRCKLSLGQVQKYKNENDAINVNVNEFNDFVIQKPLIQNFPNETGMNGIDKNNRRIGFTKKELNSLLQMKFLKKKNKTLK